MLDQKPKAKIMSETNILEMLDSERSKIQAIESQLAKKGMFMKTYRSDETKNHVEQLHDARQQVKFLDQLIASNPMLVAVTPPQPAPVQAPVPTPAPVAKLSNAEVSRLNWTMQVHYAQGKLSDDQAREIIASRDNPKKRPVTHRTMPRGHGRQGSNQSHRLISQPLQTSKTEPT